MLQFFAEIRTLLLIIKQLNAIIFINLLAILCIKSAKLGESLNLSVLLAHNSANVKSTKFKEFCKRVFCYIFCNTALNV
jgi:hypothetical protein